MLCQEHVELRYSHGGRPRTIAFSTTSLTYIGSSCPAQCSEKNVSAVLPRITSSSFFCRISGLAPVQLSVLRLRNLAGRLPSKAGDNASFVDSGSAGRGAGSDVASGHLGVEKERLRRKMPCRCRILRFYALLDLQESIGEMGFRHTVGRSRGVAVAMSCYCNKSCALSCSSASDVTEQL